jgi:hypothetical protein
MSVTRYIMRARRDPIAGTLIDAIEAPNGGFVRFEDHHAKMLEVRNEWGTDQAFKLAQLADAHARIGRLREMALASVRPAGLITSPESVRWFNARHKCDSHNDLQEGASE